MESEQFRGGGSIGLLNLEDSKLVGMRERTGRLGGRFTVDSSPTGTTVRVVLPDILPPRLPGEATTTGSTPGRRST